MLNPSSLYEFHRAPDQEQPGVLLVGLDGFMDAGHTIKVLTDHLMVSAEPELLVSFDIDQVYDYRGRRPSIVFDTNRYESYERPKLNLYRLTDRDGRVFYLLRGIEPDFQWERVAAGVIELVRTLGITTTIAWQGAPMGVPHTRPIGHSLTASDPAMINDAVSPWGRVHVPASFSQVLELRLGQAGHKAMGVVVHVPHYLADNDFPDAALIALNAIQDAAELDLPNDALVSQAAEARVQIEEAVRDSEQVTEIVQAIERQYDEFMRNREALGVSGPRPVVPSADELGAEFEAFLQSMDDQPGEDHPKDA